MYQNRWRYTVCVILNEHFFGGCTSTKLYIFKWFKAVFRTSLNNSPNLKILSKNLLLTSISWKSYKTSSVFFFSFYFFFTFFFFDVVLFIFINYYFWIWLSVLFSYYLLHIRFLMRALIGLNGSVQPQLGPSSTQLTMSPPVTYVLMPFLWLLACLCYVVRKLVRKLVSCPVLWWFWFADWINFESVLFWTHRMVDWNDQATRTAELTCWVLQDEALPEQKGHGPAAAPHPPSSPPAIGFTSTVE